MVGRTAGGRAGRGFKQGYPTAPGQGDRWGRRGLAAGEGGGGGSRPEGDSVPPGGHVPSLGVSFCEGSDNTVLRAPGGPGFPLLYLVLRLNFHLCPDPLLRC